MAESQPSVVLQPSLLDRLVPQANGNGTHSVPISTRQLRDIVKRDIAWLLNTTHLEAVQDLSAYPQVAQSVLNYGIPDLTGVYVSNADLPALERRLAKVLGQFEPRIIKDSLQVRARGRTEQTGTALLFDIRCLLWSQPHAEPLNLCLELDMDTGAVAYTLTEDAQ